MSSSTDGGDSAEALVRPDVIVTRTPRSNSRFIALLCVLLCGSVFVNGFMSRILGPSLVCMTVPLGRDDNSTANQTSDRCGYNASSRNSLGYRGTIQWNSQQQSQIIAVHDWGRLIFLPFSGFLVSLFDSVFLLGLSTLVCIAMTALFPLAVLMGGYGWVLGVRILLGVAHAFSSPSVDQIVALWTPRSIRSTLYAVITAGSQFAVLIGSPLTTNICNTNFMGGWPASFYISALVSFVWLLMWTLFGITIYRRISLVCHHDHLTMPSSVLPLSWRHANKALLIDFWKNVICRPAIWSVLPCNVAATWTIQLLVTFIPSFYRDVLCLPLASNGFYQALPFVTLVIAKSLFSWLADLLGAKTRWPRNTISKLFNTVSFVGCGSCILLTTLIPSLSPAVAIFLLTLGSGLYSACTPGFRISIVSINRQWTGVISAICTIAATLGSISFNYLMGGVVKAGTVRQWTVVFICMAVVDCIAAAFYLIFGSVEDPTKTSKTKALLEDPTIAPALTTVDNEHSTHHHHRNSAQQLQLDDDGDSKESPRSSDSLVDRDAKKRS